MSWGPWYHLACQYLPEKPFLCRERQADVCAEERLGCDGWARGKLSVKIALVWGCGINIRIFCYSSLGFGLWETLIPDLFLKKKKEGNHCSFLNTMHVRLYSYRKITGRIYISLLTSATSGDWDLGNSEKGLVGLFTLPLFTMFVLLKMRST